VAVFVTDAPTKCTPMICPLSKSDKSPTFYFTWIVAQHNHICNDKSITECKQTEEHSVLPTEFLSMFPTQILFHNVLVFPLFCPPLVTRSNIGCTLASEC
jgi:hypothetical protein